MTSVYCKIFVWFLLIGIYEMVYSDAHLEVNFEEIESLLTNTRSIFYRGNRVELRDWATGSINNINGNIKDLDLRKMLTFIKCECAYLINISIESVIGSIRPCPDELLSESNLTDDMVEPCVTGNKDVMEYLESLNKEIKLTIITIFRIVERYPNLNWEESYLSRTLLSASFYIDSFAYVKKPEDGISKSSAVLKMLTNMNRVLLQIMNLVGQFSLEYCYPNPDNEIGIADSERKWIERLNGFLTGIVVSSDTISSSNNWTFDLGTIMLEKCMQYQARSDGTYENRAMELCVVYLKTTKIQSFTAGSDITIIELYEKVKFLYELPAVYEYMVGVYQVVLKLIYLKTITHWSSFSVERCEGIIAKLQSMHFPTELIQYFQFILDVLRFQSVYGEGDVRHVFMRKFDKLTNVKIHHVDKSRIPYPPIFEEGEWDLLPLSDLIKYLLEHDLFGQFWPFFNLLYKEFEKKSSKAYDMSLNLFPEATVIPPVSFSEVYQMRCDVWTDVTEYLSKTPPQCEHISSELFEKLDNGLSVTGGIDLNNVYSVAHIQLKHFNECHQCQDGEILIRTINLIRNMLDNHGIQTCMNIENRRFAFRNECNRNEIANVSEKQNTKDKKSRKDIKTSLLSLICVPTPSKKKPKKITSGLNVNSKPTKNTKTSDYDFAKLIGKTIFEKSSLETTTNCYWRGEIKSVQYIQTDISKNMINIQDLIDYQRLCLKMLFYVFFETWFVAMLEQKSPDKVNDNFNAFLYNRMFKRLSESFNKLCIPDAYNQLVQYYISKVDIYLYVGNKDGFSQGSMKDELLKKEIMSPMAEQFGVFVDEGNRVNFDDIKKLLHITDKVWNQMEGYESVFKYTDKMYSKFMSDFKFLQLRASSFKFIHP